MVGHSDSPIPSSSSAQKRPAPFTPPRVSSAFNLNGTPVSNKTSGSQTYSSERNDRPTANHLLAEEAKGLFLGAMPPSDFLDRFLPLAQDTPECPDSGEAFAKVAAKARPKGKEVFMYTPFVSMVLVSVSAMPR